LQDVEEVGPDVVGARSEHFGLKLQLSCPG
jgi:hypothetical protein